MSRVVGTHAGPARQGRRPGTSEDLPGEVELARRVVAVLGGRYSAELGIDVNAGDAEVERWFVAATLFGARIPARVAERAFGVLAAAGLARIGQLRHVPSADLIAMLDAGGYVRYDVRTAERLLELCEVIRDRYDGQAAVIGRRFTAYSDLRAALDALPGWGPVTIRLFLRELRGASAGSRPAAGRSCRSRRAAPRPDRRPRGADGPGRARRGVRAGRARPGERAGPAGAGPPPGDGPLPRRPGLRGAAVAEAGMSVASPARGHGRAGQKVPATRDCSLSPA